MKRVALLLLALFSIAAHATVTSTTVSVSYVCTGSVGPFPFTFSVYAASSITVTQNSVVLATSAYTVTPVNNNYDNGGSVTLKTACPASQPLVITRTTPLTQTQVFTDNMPVPMKSIENGLDKLTEIAQELGAEGGTGMGTVSAVSVATENGFQGTVTNPNTTPQIAVNVDSTHVLPINTGNGATYLSNAGTYTTPAGATPLTTKGDIYGFSTGPDRLPIGSDTQVLTADSTQPLGVKWAAASSGVTLTGPVTGTGTGTIATTITPTGVTPGNYNLGGQIVVISASGQIDSVGNPFSITSFTCSQCGNFELGYSISSASGAASYANPTVPTSASVTDGTNVVTLTTPFTSWTESHTYTVNTTFTLTAIGNSQTQTATQSFQVFNCKFTGVGTGGTASGATASGSGAGNQCASETATLSGATATLVSAGLGNTNAGDSYTFNPSGQYIYLLLTGGCGHTLYFNGFPTTFNTTALTYTNILGGSQSGMCIYSSPTSYTATGTNVTVHSL